MTAPEQLELPFHTPLEHRLAKAGYEAMIRTPGFKLLEAVELERCAWEHQPVHLQRDWLQVSRAMLAEALTFADESVPSAPTEAAT